MKTSRYPNGKYLLISLFIAGFFSVHNLLAQSRSDEEIVRSVANYIVKNTSFQLINTKTNERYSSAKGLAVLDDIKAESIYNKWEYPNGVLNIGIMKIGSVLNDKIYTDYALHNFDFIFSNLDYFQNQYTTHPKSEWAEYFRMAALDDCGSMAASLADVNAIADKKEYRAYLERVAAYIMTKQSRLKDGTLSRTGPRNMTIWADDLFMSVPFLARMGKLTRDERYFNEAIKQVEQFNKYLFDPAAGLYFHCWYSDINANGVAHWLRCNGWIAMAQVELLNNLPVNNPKREELIGFLQRQIIGFSRQQDQTGLWHQLIDKTDSYPETSGTAMFTYTVARAVNQGWISPTYLTIARQGWKGLSSKINADGQVQDVCVGTGIEDDLLFYYNRPRVLNDFHVTGAVLLAGSEIIIANQKHGNSR